jgi:hypothetical protein
MHYGINHKHGSINEWEHIFFEPHFCQSLFSKLLHLLVFLFLSLVFLLSDIFNKLVFLLVFFLLCFDSLFFLITKDIVQGCPIFLECYIYNGVISLNFATLKRKDLINNSMLVKHNLISWILKENKRIWQAKI